MGAPATLVLRASASPGLLGVDLAGDWGAGAYLLAVVTLLASGAVGRHNWTGPAWDGGGPLGLSALVLATAFLDLVGLTAWLVDFLVLVASAGFVLGALVALLFARRTGVARWVDRT